MESIKNFTNAADMLAAWNSGDFEFTVEAADGHKLNSGFGKVHRLYLDAPASDYVYVYAGTGSAPIRYSYQLNTGVWRSTSGVRQLVVRRKSDRPLAVGDRVKIARKIPDHHEGWQNSWVDGMDCLVGDERTIECIYPEKKECRLVATMWGWPLAAMELVEETKKVPCSVKTAPWDDLLGMPHKKSVEAPPAGHVLPSDEAGIEAMVKRMLGQPKSAPPAAPAPQKPPFHKGLLIQASEKYMGLGFNGEK